MSGAQRTGRAHMHTHTHTHTLLLTASTLPLLPSPPLPSRSVSEACKGILIVKLLGWESSFAARIAQARGKELSEKWRVALYNAINSSAVEAGPLFASALALVTFGLTSSTPLTPGQAFTALALFQILRGPLMVLPMLTGQYAGASASLARLRDFLAAEELTEYRQFVGQQQGQGGQQGGGGAAVRLQGLRATWGPQPPAPAATGSAFTLQVGALAAPVGGITAVVGPIASGKSTLLAALLGDLHVQAGSVQVALSAEGGQAGEAGSSSSSSSSKGAAAAAAPPAIAYAAQQPFILNASLRDNILFGAALDAGRYALAVECCALAADFERLPAGDATEIGERGVNLSGGQVRARRGPVCARSALCTSTHTLSLSHTHTPPPHPTTLARRKLACPWRAPSTPTPPCCCWMTCCLLWMPVWPGCCGRGPCAAPWAGAAQQRRAASAALC